MTFVRWILGFILTLSIVIALAVVLLPRWFNPNDYRDDIELQLSQATGREIALAGNLELSVFPWLGVHTEGVKVSQPRAIGGDFMRIDTAQIRLKLIPLLNRRIELDTILLDGPTIHFITVNEQLNSLTPNPDPKQESVQGQAKAKADAMTSAADSGSNSSNSSTGIKASDVYLEGVDIRNGSLDYEDRSTKSRTQITEFNAKIGSVLSGELTPFSINGLLLADDTKALPMKFSVDGDVVMHEEGKSMVLSAFKSTLDDSEQKIDISSSQVSIEDFARIAAQGNKVNLIGASFPAPLQLDIPRLSFNIDSGLLQIPSLAALFAETNVNFSDLVVRDAIEDPKYQFNLDVPNHSLLNTLEILEIDYQPSSPQALNKVGLQGEVIGTHDSVKLNNGVFAFDSSIAALSGTVKHFSDPEFGLKIDIDTLNLDDYLPLDDSGLAKEKKGETSLAAALVVPMAVFEGFVADANLSVKNLRSAGISLSDVIVDVKSDKKKVVIKPTANLFDGKLAGNMAFGEEAGIPTLRIKNEIDLVSLGELLSSAQITDQLSGLGSLALDLVVTERDGKQFNEGTIKLFAKNGALKGVDIKGVLDTAYSQYKALQSTLRQKESNGSTASTPGSSSGNSEVGFSGATAASLDSAEIAASAGSGSAQDETRFAELLGTFNVKDFRITNTDFNLTAPLFHVTGAGLIDLAAEQVDYTVNVAVVNSMTGEVGEAIEKLKGITIPIRFSGALLAPSFSVDTNALYRLLLKRDVDEKKGVFLQEEFGIEGGENLTTKEAAKQILLDKLLNPKRDKTPANQERPLSGGATSSDLETTESALPSTQDPVERPMQPRLDSAGTTNADTEIGEVPPAEQKPLDKDALKKELGKKLLDELFK